MNITIPQNNFASGEVSPLLEGAIGNPRYQTGLRLCQNYLPLRQGGLRKRPGTHFAGNTRLNKKARLIEFTATTGEYFIIELTDQKARFWSQDFTIVGAPTELTTPWVEADLPKLHYAVMKGVAWIVHPNYSPRTITVASGVWSIATPTFTGDRTFAAAGAYPKSVFFLAGRLGFVGTGNEPNAFLLSRPPVAISGTDRFTDFSFGTTADYAIYLQEADLGGTHLHWAIAQRRLVAGTDRSVWMDNGDLVTPERFDMDLVAYTGSEEIQPVLLETVVLYIGRGGSSLHALIYSEEGGGYVDYDLSKDAEHFLSSPIVDMKVQNFPDPIVWMARSDGLLISCTLDFKNGIIAWARHPMAQGALVEALAVGLCDTEDNLWLVVKRGSARMVEYVRFCNLTTSGQADFYHVDCGKALIFGSPTNTVTGLDHLEGMEVAAWADGTVMPRKTVVSGSVTYDSSFSKISIGLPISSIMTTLRPEVPANGTSQGKKKRIEKVSVRLFRSFGGAVSSESPEGVKFLTWRSGTYVWGSVPELFTGDLGVEIASVLDEDAILSITHDDPAPFTLLAIFYRVAILEP